MARIPAAVALFLALAALVPAASAHESFTASHFTIEVSWQFEPAVVDQPNAVRIAVMDTSGGGDPTPVTDSGLVANVLYGSSSKGLEMQTTDDTPGEYFGALVPTKAGAYSVHITGDVHGAIVQKTIELENVTTVADEGFPSGHGTVSELEAKASMAMWTDVGVGALGLVVAVVALAVAVAARGQARHAAQPPVRPVQPSPPRPPAQPPRRL